MYTVYIIKNKLGKIYIGQTANLDRRLGEHNFTGSSYTSKYRPWILVYSELLQTRSEAMQREKYFKTGKGREELKQLIQLNSSSVG